MSFKSLMTAACLAAIASLGLAATAVAADSCADFPKKAVRVVVGFSAGGGTDTYARILSSVIPEYINDQPMIVVNKPGGAQVPAMKHTMGADKDGYTLQFFSAGSGVMATMLRDHGIDWFRDFDSIAQVGGVNLAVVINQKKKPRTPQEVVAWIKKSHEGGTKLRWAHPGRGSISHMAVVAWLIKNGVYDMVQDVPFKGAANARAAILGEQTDFGVLSVHHITSFPNELHGVGVLSDERDPIVKSVKTMKEQDSPYVDMYSPMMLAAPKGTPPAVIACLDAAIRKATEHKAFKELAEKATLEVRYRGAREIDTYMAKLRDEWKPTIEFVKERMAKEK